MKVLLFILLLLIFNAAFSQQAGTTGRRTFTPSAAGTQVYDLISKHDTLYDVLQVADSLGAPIRAVAGYVVTNHFAVKGKKLDDWIEDAFYLTINKKRFPTKAIIFPGSKGSRLRQP